MRPLTALFSASLICLCLLLLSPANTASAQGGETPAAGAKPDVKIGLMGPITGPWASEGQDMEKVVLLMAEEANRSGGAGGAKIVIHPADDGGTPKTAALAAQQLISAGVAAVVGTYGSAVTEATQYLYDEAGIIQIATGSTSVRLSEKGLTRFFRTCPRDDEQGRILASKVKELGFKRAAIVHDNSSYAKGLADEANSLFKDAGIETVFFDSITAGDRDFTATLTTIKTKNPDVIVFTGYYPEAALILRQKKEMNWDVPMIGGDATNNAALVESAGVNAAGGYYFVSPPGPGDIKGDRAARLLDSYQRKYEVLPSSVWAILAGDAFGVLAEAAAAVGPDSEKMAKWLHEDLKDYDGLTGSISFNEKGDRIGEVYRLYQVDDKGAFVLKE
ncbi:MAG: branched-chain amino acid ABC transporter substrate-binding protein [Deltaproteobacteria bacterium]|jgi:branched-chain amino acid transport system substrate-binding protein|nr:branched-chain amino acid ABC transporter substrate-binding protein [Deltaproteobacteria bacterium]